MTDDRQPLAWIINVESSSDIEIQMLTALSSVMSRLQPAGGDLPMRAEMEKRIAGWFFNRYGKPPLA